MSLYEGLNEDGREFELDCFDLAATSWRTASCNDPSASTCTAMPPARSRGEPCAERRFRDFHFNENDCVSGLLCWQGICIDPQVDSQVGGSCSQESFCDNDLTCVGGTCQPLRVAGEGCELEANCASSHWCDDGTCAAAKQTGASCTEERECAAPLLCTSEVCMEVEAFACFFADF